MLVTEWPEFAALDWAEVARRMARPLIVDGRNFLDAKALAAPASSTRESGGPARAPPPRPRQTEPMQAIVLVGGEGTRLRPLTATVPKPALTWSTGRSSPTWSSGWRGTGSEVVLACGFLPDVLREALGEGEAEGVRIRYVVEPEARGTAGAIRFAADQLGEELEDRFLALNGDVLTDLDLTAPLRAHVERRARATLGLSPGRGLLGLRAGQHRAGCRSPGVLGGERRVGAGEINAGMYELERSALDSIPVGREVSI